MTHSKENNSKANNSTDSGKNNINNKDTANTKRLVVKDYYKVLGVERTASSTEIRKAYLKQIRKYHPDLNQGKEDTIDILKEVIDAYKILGNLDNRLRYSIMLNRSITKSNHRSNSK